MMRSKLDASNREPEYFHGVDTMFQSDFAFVGAYLVDLLLSEIDRLRCQFSELYW